MQLLGRAVVVEHHIGGLYAVGVGDLLGNAPAHVGLVEARGHRALDAQVQRRQHGHDHVGVVGQRRLAVLEHRVFHHHGVVPSPLALGQPVGVGVFDARHGDAVQLARVGGAHERLGRKRGADDFPVLVEDVRAERLGQLLLHGVPHEHVVPHLVEVDVGQALVNERLAGRGLAGAHAAYDEQLLHTRTSSIAPPPSTVAPR